MKRIVLLKLFSICFAIIPVYCGSACAENSSATLLNVSYDPTREMYEEINQEFTKYWQAKNSQSVTVKQSHAGSGKQARAVIDGLEADVVSLALAYDIDQIAKVGKLINSDWQKQLSNNSCPYTSTILFLVRKGNPKQIKDWGDLVKEGVEVITPSPKTSGAARWSYLAAWGFADQKFSGDQTKILGFMKALFENVPVLDSGARGATTTFAQRGIGDVLLAWENEASLAQKEFRADSLEIVVPSISILAEPPVAVVDKVVDKHGTRALAEEYLKFLYTEQAQEIIAKHHFRPQLSSVAAKYKASLAELRLLNIDSDFSGWEIAQKKHFADGGTFDQIYSN